MLWRLDSERLRVFLYVVSPQMPDLTHLAEQAGWPATERGESRAYESFLSRLSQDQMWRYRLTASPVRYLQSQEGGRARRGAHVTAAQQQGWLLSKSEELGVAFAINADEAPTTLVTKRGTHSFRRGNQSQPVTITWAQFDGILRVTDPVALRQALIRGIGPGKAYGCGLLTLARID